MHRTRFWATTTFLVLVAVSQSFAQFAGAQVERSSARPAEGRGSAFRLPEAGTMLPDVTVYDEKGNDFSTSSLRGGYTVLVFGCLT